MATQLIELVDGPLDTGKPSKPKFRTVRKDGQIVKLRIVDADSPNFSADLTASFQANIRRARKENREIEDDS
ncbi:hypothetical protein AX777_07140 [Sphingobium yanoikuyae]|jgi:hypothetical protein|uniref:Uncharacterized protein n=1 Tax=Sphingobium yanoikuyae TaxID=13690 RepID=A0A177JXW5_SPHYA|nr:MULTISPECIES: hypothetical protein [Sphingobium]OAH45275.1 hypothetical protein AX777_07140 [Sphingobium yanoikuyae]PZU59213.1 MAG: hypothetical protein DI554_15480 [Sphingobium sp.]PZU64278.1 MAG: hypothetical protein DI540_20975 [Sphingobium sp.]QNG46923.1 hypothetical protein H3V42_04625 [Sphingobium yanoikuyae]